jgi:hypothetical protein
MASQLGRLQTSIHYCHHCFNWVVGDEEWEDHCQSHLSAMTSKRCGTITYCHTLVRPAYCPYCLGEDLPASKRMESWTRDRKLWIHIGKEHLKDCGWPCPCPHPLCVREASLEGTAPQFQDDTALRHHFEDKHGLRAGKSTCSDTQQPRNQEGPANTAHGSSRRNRKRKSPSGDETLEWQPIEDFEAMSISISDDCLPPPRPKKRARKMAPTTIHPPLLSTCGNEPDSPSLRECKRETEWPCMSLFEEDALEVVDLTLDPEQPSRHSALECDALIPLDDASTDPGTGSDTLFSQYTWSSPHTPSTELSGECSDEALIDLDGEDSSPSPLAKPASVDYETSQIEENTVKRPIRLRIIPPKLRKPRIVLRPPRPKPSIPARGRGKRRKQA